VRRNPYAEAGKDDPGQTACITRQDSQFVQIDRQDDIDEAYGPEDQDE